MLASLPGAHSLKRILVRAQRRNSRPHRRPTERAKRLNFRQLSASPVEARYHLSKVARFSRKVCLFLNPFFGSND
jgi:hypothetical protein